MTSVRKPGFVSDRYIAEKVMGWKVAQWVVYPAITRNLVYSDHVPEVALYMESGGRYGLLIEDGRVEHFYPTSKIACAWRVVERLQESHLSVTVKAMPFGRWLAIFDGMRDDGQSYMPPQSEQDTPSLAICAAALEAIQG